MLVAVFGLFRLRFLDSLLLNATAQFCVGELLDCGMVAGGQPGFRVFESGEAVGLFGSVLERGQDPAELDVESLIPSAPFGTAEIVVDEAGLHADAATHFPEVYGCLPDELFLDVVVGPEVLVQAFNQVVEESGVLVFEDDASREEAVFDCIL